MADITEQTNALELAQIRADLERALESIERLEHKVNGNGKEGLTQIVGRISSALFGDPITKHSGVVSEIHGVKNTLNDFRTTLIDTIDSRLQSNAQQRASEENLRQSAIDEANKERQRKFDRMHRRFQLAVGVLITIGTMSNLHLLEPIGKVLMDIMKFWQGAS